MRCSRGRMILAAVLVLALWPCAFLQAQDYEIRLHRPQVVGQKYHLLASGRMARTHVEKSGDKILKNEQEKFTVECDCVVTVLAVDDKGKPSQLSLQIERLTRTDDAGVKALVTKGSIVSVSMKDGEEVSETAGHRLSLPAQEAINVILPLGPNGPTDDELYGTNERKKPGDRWDANTDLMLKVLLRHAASANKENLNGTVTFERVINVGGTPCLQISGSMDCSQYVPFVSSEVKVEKGFLKIGFSEKLPVAASRPAPETTQSSSFGYTLRGRPNPTGEEQTVDVGGTQSNFSRVTDAPAGPPAPQ